MEGNFLVKVVANTFPSVLAVVGGAVIILKDDDFLGVVILVFALVTYLIPIVKEW